MASDRDQQPDLAQEAPQPAPSHTPPPITGGPAGMIALQQSAGNAAVSRLMNQGSPLPAGATAASALLGSAASEVRVHRDGAAPAGRPAALAVTEGTDIHLAPQAPATDSPSGRLLLAHEAAHVLQQRHAGPEATTATAEAEADEAAVAATLGEPAAVRSAARGPQFFEAPKHQATLSTAMDRHGFTDAEQEAAYFGNWARDLSQALVPFLDDLLGRNATFQIVNMMAIRHFGHGVTPSQLGAYSTREHIDNPAGTTDFDVLAANRRTIEGYPDTADPISGKAHQNVADVAGQEELSPDRIAESFEVNASGIPAYIERSRTYIQEEFNAAVDAGRNEAGLYHLGNFSHTCEDLFAHSNWVEVALGRLIREGQLPLPAAAQAEVDERMAQGKPPVEDYAAQAIDQAGNVRPILATGTFTGGSGTGDRKGHDTFISLSEELKNLVEMLDPFKESVEAASNWDFLMELLVHMDATADEGLLGGIVGGMMEPLLEKINELAGSATEGVDSLDDSARETFGDGFLGDLAAGAAGLLSSGVHAVVDPARDAGVSGAKALVKSFVDAIGKTGISLAMLAVWVQKGEGWLAEKWQAFKDGIRNLPAFLRERILPGVVEAERNFKREVNRLGSSHYDKAVRSFLGELAEHGNEATDIGATNVNAKYLEWGKGLADHMRKTLKEVGGRTGEELGDGLPSGDKEEDIPVIVLYAESTFPMLLGRLMQAAENDAMAEEILKGTDAQVRQLQQLANVPEWARAGASHSQIAKDHATSPFFGMAWQVANAADTMLVGALMEAWQQAGYAGPADSLNENYGERDATGGQVVDEDPEEGFRARPVLADSSRALSPWEQEARKLFLENRMMGQQIAATGLAPDQTIGTSLLGMADRLVEIASAYPILGPQFDDLIVAIREDQDLELIVAAMIAADAAFNDYASSGRLDDDVMNAVDALFSQANTLIHRAQERLEHELGHGIGHDHEGHEHEGEHSPDPEPVNPTGHLVHTREQIALLDRYRGNSSREGAPGGVAVGALNAATTVGALAAADARAEAATDPRERFMAELDRIFAHPYDSNWWVPIVQGWAADHPDVLAAHIRDRNAGVAEVH